MRTLLKTLVLALCLAPLTAPADSLPAVPYIQVTGHGELHTAPDILYVALTVEKTDLDLKAARADVEQRSSAVLELLRKLGVADKDITAAAIYVNPQYVWKNSTQHLTGQHVTRSVAITLRDIARYGDLVDGLISAGITRLDGVTPDVSNREALREQALELAVVQAHDKAIGLAKSAGVNLGAVYSIAEQGGGYSPRPLMMDAAARNSGAESAPEYVTGDIQISADVGVIYLINNSVPRSY
jgi:uncharacterized protein YggE